MDLICIKRFFETKGYHKNLNFSQKCAENVQRNKYLTHPLADFEILGQAVESYTESLVADSEVNNAATVHNKHTALHLSTLIIIVS